MIPTNSPPKRSMKSKPITVPKPYGSPSYCSAWNAGSLKDALPESPPPICSSGCSTGSLASFPRSPTPDKFFFNFSGEDSWSPEKQSSCTAWNSEKDSRVEADEYTHNANHAGSLALSNMQHNYPQGAEMDSNSPQGYSGQPIISQSVSNRGSPDSLSQLMTRPKPYSAFLEDVKKQEFEAEIEAWKRAKKDAILDRLTSKEALISEWESRHTSKAMEEMKKVENQLEKLRAKAFEKLQKRISITKAEVDKKARKARQEALEKMNEVSKLSNKARATKSFTCLKL